MQKKTKIILLAVVLIVLALIGYNASRKTPLNYTGARVDRGEVKQTVSATGTVEAIEKVELKFLNSGKITEINVRAGSEVKAGDLLAKLDVAKLESQLAQSTAAMAVAAANVETIQEGASSEDVRVAETSIDNAEIALRSAQQNLEDTRSSTEKETASAEAASASAELSLGNVKAGNENSLGNAYAVAWDTAISALTACDDALDANKTILEDEGAKNTLSVRDTQYLNNSKSSRRTAESSRDAAETYVRANASAPAPAVVDAALGKAQAALGDTKNTLSDTYDVLQATVTSSMLTQAELDAFKASISAQRTGINSSILNLNAKKLAIATQKVANQSSLDGSQSAADTAKRNLSSVQVGATAKINAAENAVAAREGELKQARERLEQVKAKPSSSKIAAAEAQVDQARASVELIRGQIEDATILAPYDGLITNVTGEVGEIASASDPVVSMMIPNGFQIVSNISEVSISKLKVGDSVALDFDALGADQVFTGRVSEIDPAQTEISGVVYYKVTTIFTADGDVVKSGMTANLEILTAQKDGTLRIPFQALKEKEGRKYVQTVDADQRVSEIYVEVGLRGDSYYEVTGGLAEGQEIATFIQQ